MKVSEKKLVAEPADNKYHNWILIYFAIAIWFERIGQFEPGYRFIYV